MSFVRTVWIHEDVDVIVYEDDGNGVRVNPTVPLLQYCYLQDTSLKANLPMQRRDVWGRPKKKIVVGAYEYTFDCTHFYFWMEKEFDLTKIFNREKRIQLDIFYSQGSRREIHTLKIACATSFVIATKTTSEATGSLTIEAEEYSQGT